MVVPRYGRMGRFRYLYGFVTARSGKKQSTSNLNARAPWRAYVCREGKIPNGKPMLVKKHTFCVCNSREQESRNPDIAKNFYFLAPKRHIVELYQCITLV